MIGEIGGITEHVAVDLQVVVTDGGELERPQVRLAGSKTVRGKAPSQLFMALMAYDTVPWAAQFETVTTVFDFWISWRDCTYSPKMPKPP